MNIFSGGRPEGSKRNLKFQSATWPQAPSSLTQVLLCPRPPFLQGYDLAQTG